MGGIEANQEMEWKKAQNIDPQVDLVSAAKTHLKFLAAVDRNRWLYDGPGLEKAIYRYNACWLPLLANQGGSVQLVVPLDCEWIWHCHRLNPIRYKKDCEELFGRILDNKNVFSSLDGISTIPTQEIWEKHFPLEPYELDLEDRGVVPGRCTDYDLISAVKRQAPFFYQVSRPHMMDDRYIKGAVARYKAFLHLIRRNKKGLDSFSVPTYDIDVIWHTHQLHPVSYCEDLMNIMGFVLEHDDTDSDRSKGQKLDTGFSETTEMYEEMYGARYWRAGAMYRGIAPAPIGTIPYSGVSSKMAPELDESKRNFVPTVDVFEVMLEFISVRNLPEGYKGRVSVLFSKTQPDAIFNAKRSLSILSETGEKQVASFKCQPNGSLVFELVSLHKSSETIGKISMPLEEFLLPDSDLVTEKWLDLAPSRKINGKGKIGLRVAISVTVPASAPYELRMIRSRAISHRSCLFPLPTRVRFARKWTRIVNNAGNIVLSLQLRDEKQSKGNKGSRKRVTVDVPGSDQTRDLLESTDSGWSMVNTPWSLRLPALSSNDSDGHLLELNGPKTVRLYPGGRLDYEPKGYQNDKDEDHVITAVEFSADHPYGRAAALLDPKSGDINVKDEWFVLPGVLLMFILDDQAVKNGYQSLVLEKQVEAAEEKSGGAGGCGGCGAGGCGGGCGDGIRAGGSDAGGCGGCGAGGCGGGCGDGIRAGGSDARSGGCGGCGAGGCGAMGKDGTVVGRPANDGGIVVA